MTLASITALFASMLVLALLPSISVLTVTTRSATSGFLHGAFTALGIVVGDTLFILLAISGLSLLAETMGELFSLVKYAGGVYLIWLGVKLWLASPETVNDMGAVDASFVPSFLAGLFVTIGDQKAIFFYLGFLPAFIDLQNISIEETAIIVSVAIVAVGGVKLGYAFVAAKAGNTLKEFKVIKVLNKVAGLILLSIGVFLIVVT
ncbi:MAG: LysE family translocator [Gammaproteobacteria bacterium]